MKKISDYLEHVDECRTMARATSSPEHRQQLLNMALTWEQLADARKRKLVKSGVAVEDDR